MNIIYLYGPPASGKSTLGRLFAAKNDFEFIDLDAEIEKAAAKRIPEIFKTEGEKAFRKLEKETLKRVIVAVKDKNTVIALGGGALLVEESRQLAEETGEIVVLECSEEELSRRIAAQKSKRPLLENGTKTENKLKALLLARQQHYSSFPTHLSSSSSSLEDACEALTEVLKRK